MDQQAKIAQLRPIIREAFSLYDKNNVGAVAGEFVDICLYYFREVCFILRYLGLFPSESEILDNIMKELQNGDIGNNVVTFDTLEPFLLQCLLRKDYQPDDADTLLEAFRALDEEGKGWIEVSKLREFMLMGSDPLSEVKDKSADKSEMDRFLDYGKIERSDGQTDRFYYEDYVADVSDMVSKHLRNLFSHKNTAASVVLGKR